jgi:hypothetical protein
MSPATHRDPRRPMTIRRRPVPSGSREGTAVGLANWQSQGSFTFRPVPTTVRARGRDQSQPRTQSFRRDEAATFALHFRRSPARTTPSPVLGRRPRISSRSRSSDTLSSDHFDESALASQSSQPEIRFTSNRARGSSRPMLPSAGRGTLSSIFDGAWPAYVGRHECIHGTDPARGAGRHHD